MADVKQRPHHRRNASSKSLFKSLVSPKSRPLSPESTMANAKTYAVPTLPADSGSTASTRDSTRDVLGERQGNVQSPPASPSKKKGSLGRSSKDAKRSKAQDGNDGPKKSKSSTNLAAVFAKMNRSTKEHSAAAAARTEDRDKENTTPPPSATQPLHTPIWAQFASTNSSSHSSARPPSRSGGTSSNNLQEEIDRYTPKEYSPSKQRNFNGSFDAPSLRPSLNKPRPQSAHLTQSENFMSAMGRRVSGDKKSLDGRRSEDSGRRLFPTRSGKVSTEKDRIIARQSIDRKVSGSSAEHPPAKDKLNLTKRGGRVMAAVAALQSKNKESDRPREKDDVPIDPKEVDAQFEAVLDARNIPEPMRQKMRSLTMRVKADFIKQDQGSTMSSESSPPGTMNSVEKCKSSVKLTTETTKIETKKDDDDESKATKRSRTRSRTFTFSRGRKEEKAEDSPSKKHKSQSRSRPNSIIIPDDKSGKGEKTPTTPTGGSFGRKAAPPTLSADYITYLRKNQDPTKVEVGRLHKLRILLRNETVAWVDSFISQDGMSEIVGLIKRTMGLEWREDHEDQLLHESLLCLKGLCTTARAMVELNKFADDVFPALLGMLFDEEKKGPAEYSTRTIIMNVLFNFLSSETNSSSADLENRARTILRYLGEPPKPEDARPVDFVLGMRIPRPYKLWSREVNNVTREVFWIFLHHLNVVPLPKPSSRHSQSASTDDEDRKKLLASTYTQRHFPGSRPPVPAAPYIGGVEWDATIYMTAHLDLLNGLIASIPELAARNMLREEMNASGWEKLMGGVLRTCKEKFYSGVHDGLRAWAAAAHEDGWDTRFVREGPTEEEVADEAMKQQRSPKKSPKKKTDVPPKLDALPSEPPKLDLGLGLSMKKTNYAKDDDDGWLG